MIRPAIALTAVALVAACATTEPVSQERRTIPAPPPMPAAEIPPGGQPANLGTAHASACTFAIFSEVPERIDGVERVQADDASLTEFPESAGNIRVAGSGRYYRSGSEWQPFRFDCLYDTATARIASFDIVSL